VIVIARGGGDPQHLLGFSDERLLRAVAAASTPVVSAIGHENDHPLLDDVADLRASTPTDAAKRIVPDVVEQRAVVAQLRSRLTTRLSQRVSHDIAQLEQLRSRPVLRAPESMIDARSQQLWLLIGRGRDIVDRGIESQARRAAELRAALRTLSPASTLARGYAIAHLTDGVIVRDAAQASAGTPVLITVGRGSFAARSEGAVAEGPPAATAGDDTAEPSDEQI
jgi:exodeoxyribonuclease VII large subunit